MAWYKVDKVAFIITNTSYMRLHFPRKWQGERVVGDTLIHTWQGEMYRGKPHHINIMYVQIYYLQVEVWFTDPNWHQYHVDIKIRSYKWRTSFFNSDCEDFTYLYPWHCAYFDFAHADRSRFAAKIHGNTWEEGYVGQIHCAIVFLLGS